MVSILSITNFDNILQEGDILPEVLFARIIDFLMRYLNFLPFQQHHNIKLIQAISYKEKREIFYIVIFLCVQRYFHLMAIIDKTYSVLFCESIYSTFSKNI